MWSLSEDLYVTVCGGCVEIVGKHRFVLNAKQWVVLPLNKVAGKLRDKEAALYRLPFHLDVQCLPRVVFVTHDKPWDLEFDERDSTALTPDEWFELVRVSADITEAICLR